MEKATINLLGKNIAKLIQERCHGCQVDHLSQKQHSCIMLDSEEHIKLYFEEAWDRINFDEVLIDYKKIFKNYLTVKSEIV